MLTIDGVLAMAESAANAFDAAWITLLDASGDTDEPKQLDRALIRVVVAEGKVTLRHDPIKWAFAKSRTDITGWRIHNGAATLAAGMFAEPRRIRQAGDSVTVTPIITMCEVKNDNSR